MINKPLSHNNVFLLYIYIYTYTCMYKCVCVCVCRYMTYIYIYIYVCVCVCVYVRVFVFYTQLSKSIVTSAWLPVLSVRCEWTGLVLNGNRVLRGASVLCCSLSLASGLSALQLSLCTGSSTMPYFTLSMHTAVTTPPPPPPQTNSTTHRH